MAQLGPTDLAYVITFFALTRLGYTILCLSPRLAPDACAKLIAECGPVAVIPGRAPHIEQLVEETNKLTLIDVVEAVSREGFDMPDAGEERFSRKHTNRETERDWTCCVLHSSGSAGLPKAIRIPHRRLMIQIPPSPEKLEYNTFPMFHGYGSWVVIHNCMNRKSTYMNNPNRPLTADYLIKVLEHVKPQVLHVVPYTMKLLALSERGIEAMKSCRRVVFSGSGCPDNLGDLLVEKGVNIESVWGATEMGFLGSSSNRPPGDKAWNYIRIPKPINDHVWFKNVEDDTYECIYLKGLPSLVASNSDDPPGSFWSKDLFEKHPIIPSAWKHIGRLDDRLTLANGEKVLPLPMEGRIRQDSLIKENVVFGTGRSIPGVLIFRNDDSASLNDREFIDRIWPTIQVANAHAESFSQISKETIIPMGVDVDYPKTDKESIKRAQVYTKFSREIEAMYDNLTYHGSGTLRLDIPQMEKWLLDTFNDQIGVPISNIDDDFFAAGVNSSQAIRMRGLMLKDIDLGDNTRRLGENVVFDMGTVARLARCIHSLQLGEDLSYDSRDELQEMDSLIRRYSSFRKQTAGSMQVDGKVVLLTGVTGSLGAELLAQCLRNPSIKHIYCLVRGPDPTDRVLSALHQRDLTKPSSAQFTALTADLSDPFLGLSMECYASLQSHVTHVIHSAWAVNFNLGIRSFESQHIAGVHNLLQMTLSSPLSNPARFCFCSSVAVALATPAPVTISEGPIEDLAHALPQGYARSKLVAEHILLNAKYNYGARIKIFRIGQIAGDKRTGLWSDTEVVPLIIRSALTLEALPELNETESWLPVDTLVSSICDLAGLCGNNHAAAKKLDADKELVYNLQNPATFHWTKDLLPELARLGLQFETIPPLVWLEKLREYKGDVEANPAVKLLDHFEKMYAMGGSVQGESKNKGSVNFELEKAQRDSESLRTAPKLVQGRYIEKYMAAWIGKWKGERREHNIESSG